MMKNHKLAIALLLVLGACAQEGGTSSLVQGMQPPDKVDETLKGAVSVGDVTGGSDQSGVSNDEFKTALQQGLAIHGLLADDQNSATWVVDVVISPASASKKISSEPDFSEKVTYKLVERSNHLVAATNTITTSASYEYVTRDNLERYLAKLDRY